LITHFKLLMRVKNSLLCCKIMIFSHLWTIRCWHHEFRSSSSNFIGNGCYCPYFISYSFYLLPTLCCNNCKHYYEDMWVCEREREIGCVLGLRREFDWEREIERKMTYCATFLGEEFLQNSCSINTNLLLQYSQMLTHIKFID